MKKRVNKSLFFLVVIFAVLCAIACLCWVATPTAATTTAFAASDSDSQATLVYKEETVSEVEYAALGRTNLCETNAFTVDQANYATDGQTGLMGNSAVRQASFLENEKNYKAYYIVSWTNAFEANKTYEISFYTKSENAASNFLINVWLIDADGIKLEGLPQVKNVEGVWTKYSLTFTATAAQAKKFTMHLDAKTMTGVDYFEAVWYDQFSAVLVDDYNPIVCGERFDESFWVSGVENGTVTSFNGGDYPAALQMTTGSLVSDIHEVPEGGTYLLRFAVKKTDGASVKFSVKSAISETIDEVVVKANGEGEDTFCYTLATSDLTDAGFVYFQFDVEGASAEDYAIIGAFEMVEHVHETASGTPDPTQCKLTATCKTCGLEVVTYSHNWVVDREATCKDAGKMHCANALCQYNSGIEIPATGEHICTGGTCSPENSVNFMRCDLCNQVIGFYPSEHTMVCVSVSETEHKYECSVCHYEESVTTHDTDKIRIVKLPSATAAGYAVLDCDACSQRHGIALPCIGGDAEGWILSVEKEETCLETGVVRYTLIALPAIYVEYDTEALGHDYENIKSMPTCTEDGVSLHHKCTRCGYVKETEAEITVLEAYGHDVGEWTIVTEPTLESDGLRRKYCSRCGEMEEEVIPMLDEVNYTKYALEEPDESEGFYYYYESAEYGTYAVFVEGTNEDGNTILIIGIAAAVVVVGSVVAYCTVMMITKKKRK